MKRYETMAASANDILSLEHTVPALNVDEFRGSPEELKDFLFDSYMKQQLLEDFFESLAGYLDDTDIDAARETMVEFDDNEIYAALSLPHELRDRKFEEFERRLSAGEDIKKVFKQFIETSAKYEFGVGYHTSAVDIRPDEEGRWVIKGTEADHRDGDLMMAYYSSQYRHLFKKRHPKFIYIVRTEPETHRTDGNWHRAPSLSVIARVPFEDVNSYVEQTARKKETTSEEMAD